MPYRFSAAQKCTFLKSSCSIFSKPSSWSTLEARVGGDSLLLEVGNKNKCSQILPSSHRASSSLLCTKQLCVSVLPGMSWIHTTKKKYLTQHMEHVQHIIEENKLNPWLSAAIPSHSLSQLPLITPALSYHSFGQPHIHTSDKKEPAKRFSCTYSSSVFTSQHHENL